LYKLGLSSPGSLQEDFQRLLQSQNLADIAFEINGETIRCHKCIVAIRCPKLAPLLEEQDRIILDDVSADDFKGLLQFMYTDKIHTKNATFQDMLSLYRAATNYGMER
jgi:speckle-type POZ protein